MLRPGDAAPDFSLPDQGGRILRLRDFPGERVVLYFYPADDSPTCTVEAGEFRGAWRRIRAAGAVVLGVSPDGVASHRRFRSRYRLPFPLLSDEGAVVARRYGAWGAKQMFGRKYEGILRTTFVLDAERRIMRVFERVRARGHAAQVLEALR